MDYGNPTGPLRYRSPAALGDTAYHPLHQTAGSSYRLPESHHYTRPFSDEPAPLADNRWRTTLQL